MPVCSLAISNARSPRHRTLRPLARQVPSSVAGQHSMPATYHFRGDLLDAGIRVFQVEQGLNLRYSKRAANKLKLVPVRMVLSARLRYVQAMGEGCFLEQYCEEFLDFWMHSIGGLLPYSNCNSISAAPLHSASLPLHHRFLCFQLS